MSVRQLVTLEDAGHHITKLPKAEQLAAEWQGHAAAPLIRVMNSRRLMSAFNARSADHNGSGGVGTQPFLSFGQCPVRVSRLGARWSLPVYPNFGHGAALRQLTLCANKRHGPMFEMEPFNIEGGMQ